MEFCEFERIMSSKRMKRYVEACNGNTRKAMSLYRLNQRLAEEMFTIISYYEVALRNAIDRILVNALGTDWLRDAISSGGIFDNPRFLNTTRMMKKAYAELVSNGNYSNSKMLAAMEFGVWKYMYSAPQYKATGRLLLKVFPDKPKSSAQMQYNNNYIFNELDAVNRMRNRIAHHEPVCFMQNDSRISTEHLQNVYYKVMSLFEWMGIDSKSLLYGMDHVKSVCCLIEKL
ncbi:MAG: Abi family protein [Bacteroidaceae bacterium]|nr:Abi family protein [Bacteroidaceae bacterium]